MKRAVLLFSFCMITSAVFGQALTGIVLMQQGAERTIVGSFSAMDIPATAFSSELLWIEITPINPAMKIEGRCCPVADGFGLIEPEDVLIVTAGDLRFALNPKQSDIRILEKWAHAGHLKSYFAQVEYPDGYTKIVVAFSRDH